MGKIKTTVACLVLALSTEMRRVFDWAVAGREAARLLADLRQGDGLGVGLFDPIPHPGRRVPLERGGAVGHVPAWAG